MNELALRQQQTIDRIALVGSMLAFLGAALFLALDPIQTVARRSPGARATIDLSRVTAPAATATGRSPLVRLDLPSPTWTVVTDGTRAAYSRTGTDDRPAIIVRSLHGSAWSVAYEAAEGGYLGQLSLAKGILAFEEIALPGTAALPSRIAVRALDLQTGELSTIDTYSPAIPGSASPVTDGTRVLWIRQTEACGAGCQELRERDLATGRERTAFATTAQLGGIALWADTVAFSAVADRNAMSYRLDLASGAVALILDFGFSYVQSVGPDGIVLTGGIGTDAPAASWLVAADGTRTRLASDCFNIAMTARVLAMRCASQLEIRDRVTGTSLYRYAGDAGALAVYDTGVVWGEGAELVLYELPALDAPELPRPD